MTLASFIPFPGGYLVSLAIWWFAARLRLGLPWLRAAALFGILAALSFLSRLAILGALEILLTHGPSAGASAGAALGAPPRHPFNPSADIVSGLCQGCLAQT